MSIVYRGDKPFIRISLAGSISPYVAGVESHHYWLEHSKDGENWRKVNEPLSETIMYLDRAIERVRKYT